ncbi:MAG: hypothetical protein EHM58_05890 [Ignavibacteriae bacterium]|nr:MAG: hypothetical protein EHM58_05890 [Ignavibacteriota bacterium]
MKKIKIVTSKKFKELMNVNLWAQKFNRKAIDSVEGFSNVVNYVRNNRMKHDLSESEELEKAIQMMLTPFDNYSWGG